MVAAYKSSDTTKAPAPFWLDGGYDRELVEACPYHPDHRWWEFRVGDVVENVWNPDERMVICRACYVPRCGYTADPDPCIRPRHHQDYHATPSGLRWPIGGNPPTPDGDLTHGD